MFSYVELCLSVIINVASIACYLFGPFLAANLKVLNGYNHGIVEICCIEGHTELLQYLVKIDNPDIPVWKNILRFCSSTDEEVTYRATALLYPPSP